MNSTLENNEILPEESLARNLLLVEDDLVSQDVTRLFLKGICKMDIAKNGNDAVEKVSNNKYDVILMDINLGSGMNGIESLKKIRQINGYENTPIVALTAYAMKGDKESFLSSGCTHYLSKPFDKKTLVELINEILYGVKG